MYNVLFVWTSSWSYVDNQVEIRGAGGQQGLSPIGQVRWARVDMTLSMVLPSFWCEAPGLPLVVPKYRFRSNASQHLGRILVS